MKVSDFLQLYRLDPTVMTVGARLNPATAHTLRAADKDPSPPRLHLRGLVGSWHQTLAAQREALRQQMTELVPKLTERLGHIDKTMAPL